jgi:hypothetical protein
MCSNKTTLLSTITSGNDRYIETIDHSGDPNMLPINKMMNDARKDECINSQSRLYVAIAWSNVKELILLKLFSEVVHCDATCDTNNSKNHLITFSGRTSTGKKNIFLPIWVANQQRVMFKWIFSSVLPNFVQKDFFD